jgi:carboxypeptidase Taq
VEIANGETKNLLNWLRNKVHKHGRMYTSNELCELITGEKLNTNYFIEYISNKIKTLQ